MQRFELITRPPARAAVGVGGLLGGLARGLSHWPSGDPMVSSLDVQTTREDAWDRWPIVPGSWDWGASVCRGWSWAVTTRRWPCGFTSNGAGRGATRAVAVGAGRGACATRRSVRGA